MHYEVLSCHINTGDNQRLLESTMELQSNEAHIWLEMLSHFTTETMSDGIHLNEVLCHIEHTAVLPALSVLQVLGFHSAVTLASIKKYLMHTLSSDQTSIKEDVAAINKYVKETSRMHAEVHELHNSPRIFQNNRCSACAATLELPASHFLCMHSFHQRCVECARYQ